MNVLDLFSGIGGFSLGLERAGMRTVAFCEIDPYCRRVLARHWPDVPCYDDVTTLTVERLAADGIAIPVSHANGRGSLEPVDAAERRTGMVARQPARHQGIDVICGGFPCQDLSYAGKGAGIGGARSGLWSEYARIIGEVRPHYVIVENVAALLGRGLERVLGDLAALGFDAEWHCVPASAIGAPHRRDRVWIVAYSNGVVGTSRSGDADKGTRRRHINGSSVSADVAHPDQPRLEGRLRASLRECAGECAAGESGASASDPDSEPQEWIAEPRRQCGYWQFEPDVGRVAHGVPARVDRLRSLGNAVVPQIPEIIGRAIMSTQP